MTRQQLAFEMGVTPERLQFIQQAPSLEEAKNRLMALKVEAKAAYKRLAFRYHPDRNPGNAEAEACFKLSGEVLQEIEKFEITVAPPVPMVRVHFHRAGATHVYGAAYDTSTSTARIYDARKVAFIRV